MYDPTEEIYELIVHEAGIEASAHVGDMEPKPEDNDPTNRAHALYVQQAKQFAGTPYGDLCAAKAAALVAESHRLYCPGCAGCGGGN